MSEATKEIGTAQEARAPTSSGSDEAFSLSAEEADRVASQFKPAWEMEPGEQLDANAQVPSEDNHPIPAAATDLNDSREQPVAKLAVAEPADAEPVVELVAKLQPSANAWDETAKPARAAADTEPTDDLQESRDAQEHVGPIDIVADIPKRTAIELKDEPSIIVPYRPPEPVEAPEPAPPPSAQAIDPLPGDSDRRARNMKIVVGVVAVGLLVVVVGGARALLSGNEDVVGKNTAAPTETQKPKVNSVEAPVATPEPKVTVEPEVTAAVPPEDTPKEVAPEEPPESPPTTTAAPPKATTAKPHTTAPPPKTTATPPKTSATKPPKPPTKPPAAGKDPGGIVRETPF